MTEDKKPERPIGYWLKRADNLLTEEINKVQAANRVSRSEWQVLNMLSEMGSASKERIFEGIQAFVDAPSLDEIITGFVERGWIEQSGVSEYGKIAFQLTEEGRRKHGIILATQTEVRQRAMQDISEEEYMTAIRVLRKIVSNLEGNGELADRQDSVLA